MIDIVPDPYHHQITDMNLLSGVTASGGGGALVESMVVDSAESAAAVIASSSSAASVSSSPSLASAITTSSMGASVSVASSSNMVHVGRGSVQGVLLQQGTGNMLSGPNGGVNVVASAVSGAGGVASGPMGIQMHSGITMGGGNNNGSNTSSGHINEQAAISEIEKSLRQYEKGGNYSGSPPAYSMHIPPNKFLTRGVGGNGPVFSNNGMSVALNNMSIPNNNQQGFPMPPNYSQRPVGGVVAQRMPMVGGQVPRYQNMQRERLLEEQKKQQLVVPVNATNTGLNPGLADIGSLINNTVAPNVSLQRNNNVMRDAQLSPGFNSNAFQQMSPRQSRAGPPFSPVQPQQQQQQQQVQTGQQGPPPNYQTFTGNTEMQPMSPQFGTPDMMSLLNMGKATAGNNGGVLAQQLSPRQPPFSSPQPQNQWTQQQQQQISLQQQQNPMLSAQLTVGDLKEGTFSSGIILLFLSQQANFPNRTYVNTGVAQRPQQQQQRSLNSPGVTRQNSFPGPGEGGFPGPPSPSQAPFGGTNMGGMGAGNTTGIMGGPGGASNVMTFNAQNAQQQQQLQRIQRQPSIPQGAQHLPGEEWWSWQCGE